MTTVTEQDILLAGTKVDVLTDEGQGGRQRYWRSGWRVAALTDGGKVYVEYDVAFAGQHLMLVKAEEVRLPK